MDTDDPEIDLLRRRVTAAQEELDLATIFHEVWKPAEFDKELHERMGVSFATNAFRVINLALRREMLLALMRLWDSSARGISMERIANALRNRSLIEALATHRARLMPAAKTAMLEALGNTASEALELIEKYSEGGPCWETRRVLRNLRNERLAHRQTDLTQEDKVKGAEIEAFYSDMATIVSLLLSLVKATSYDPGQTAEVYRGHARLFWAGVRGEQTEGHPNFRSPKSAAPAADEE